MNLHVKSPGEAPGEAPGAVAREPERQARHRVPLFPYSSRTMRRFAIRVLSALVALVLLLGLVLAESLLVAVLGGLIGAGLFVVALPGFRALVFSLPMGGIAAGIRLFPEVLAFAFLVTVFVGLAAGIVPAVRSATRPITDGLRQVG